MWILCTLHQRQRYECSVSRLRHVHYLHSSTMHSSVPQGIEHSGDMYLVDQLWHCGIMGNNINLELQGSQVNRSLAQLMSHDTAKQACPEMWIRHILEIFEILLYSKVLFPFHVSFSKVIILYRICILYLLYSCQTNSFSNPSFLQNTSHLILNQIILKMMWFDLILSYRKKMKTTSEYIYNTLFVNGENSDVTIKALGKSFFCWLKTQFKFITYFIYCILQMCSIERDRFI